MKCFASPLISISIPIKIKYIHIYKLFIYILRNLPFDLKGKKYAGKHHLSFNTEEFGNLPISKYVIIWNNIFGASPVTQMVKNLPAVQETWIQSLGWVDSLEKGMTTYPSILAWEISWTEEPGRWQSTGT